MAAEYVLWGCYRPLDYLPIRITGGTLRECRSALRLRQTEGESWRGLAIYAKGTAYPAELAEHHRRAA